MLCDTSSGNVQKSPIWSLGSVGGNVDEVEISTVSTTQSPAHSDIYNSTAISREFNTGEGGDRRGTYKVHMPKIWYIHNCYQQQCSAQKKLTLDIHFANSGRSPDIYNIFIKHGQKSLADLETNRHSKFSAPTQLQQMINNEVSLPLCEVSTSGWKQFRYIATNLWCREYCHQPCYQGLHCWLVQSTPPVYHSV